MSKSMKCNVDSILKLIIFVCFLIYVRLFIYYYLLVLALSVPDFDFFDPFGVFFLSLEAERLDWSFIWKKMKFVGDDPKLKKAWNTKLLLLFLKCQYKTLVELVYNTTVTTYWQTKQQWHFYHFVRIKSKILTYWGI